MFSVEFHVIHKYSVRQRRPKPYGQESPSLCSLLTPPRSPHLSTHLLEAVLDCKETLEQAGKKAFRAT